MFKNTIAIIAAIISLVLLTCRTSMPSEYLQASLMQFVNMNQNVITHEDSVAVSELFSAGEDMSIDPTEEVFTITAQEGEYESEWDGEIGVNLMDVEGDTIEGLNGMSVEFTKEDSILAKIDSLESRDIWMMLDEKEAEINLGIARDKYMETKKELEDFDRYNSLQVTFANLHIARSEDGDTYAGGSVGLKYKNLNVVGFSSSLPATPFGMAATMDLKSSSDKISADAGLHMAWVGRKNNSSMPFNWGGPANGFIGPRLNMSWNIGNRTISGGFIPAAFWFNGDITPGLGIIEYKNKCSENVAFSACLVTDMATGQNINFLEQVTFKNTVSIGIGAYMKSGEMQTVVQGSLNLLSIM